MGYRTVKSHAKRPYGYQDGVSFTLPHSKLLVMYSKRRYRFQESETIALFPDVYIPLTRTDIKSGRDKVMEWVLEDIETRNSEYKGPKD